MDFKIYQNLKWLFGLIKTNKQTLISSFTGINDAANLSIYSSVITFSPDGTNGGLNSLL